MSMRIHTGSRPARRLRRQWHASLTPRRQWTFTPLPLHTLVSTAHRGPWGNPTVFTNGGVAIKYEVLPGVACFSHPLEVWFTRSPVKRSILYLLQFVCSRFVSFNLHTRSKHKHEGRCVVCTNSVYFCLWYGDATAKIVGVHNASTDGISADHSVPFTQGNVFSISRPTRPVPWHAI